MPSPICSSRLAISRAPRFINNRVNRQRNPVALAPVASLLVLTVAASTLVFVRAHAAVYSRSTPGHHHGIHQSGATGV